MEVRMRVNRNLAGVSYDQPQLGLRFTRYTHIYILKELTWMRWRSDYCARLLPPDFLCIFRERDLQ